MNREDDLVKLARQLRWQLGENFHDKLVEGIYADAHQIVRDAVQRQESGATPLDIKIDRIVTSKRFGFPIMFALLALVLWLTVVGANYPSAWLHELLIGKLYPLLHAAAGRLHLSPGLAGMLIDGMYLSTAWVISVMLPPMAIFFPLFTLLEDLGYLPRVAFNLDRVFRGVGAHGKQALTMTMGFGCNAAGVIATRIIDSPRERLIAIITNNFSLCNGRWPLQILLATIFIGALVPAQWSGLAAMAAVVGIAMLGIAFMFLSSWLLSRTALRGEVSSFHLELPPYRPPRIWKTIYTSLMDRTLIVLWRAIIFAAPAGILIWVVSNIQIHGVPLAARITDALDPIGWWMGLNGIILLAYIIAIPANELVIPAILMLTVLIHHHTAGVTLFEPGQTTQVATLLRQNGWTLLTAVNLMLFSLLHNPCSTTIYTIYKETGSVKWTAMAVLLPLLLGILITVLIAFFWRL